MVLLASVFDQSKYMRAEDLKSEKTLRIKSTTAETAQGRNGQEQKLVVWFTNTQKGLMLNKTNNRTIRGAYGDDTAGWVGKLIVVFPAQTEYAGRPILGLRVRIPPPKQRAGNGQTAQPQAAPPPQPAPEVVVDEDDFDDEIPLVP